MYTLGIETSCDETSAAVLKDFNVLANITISSLRENKPYGGVIPEIATRAHVKNIDKVVSLALKKSKVNLKKIDLIAVTNTPGLFGALVVGLNFAKTLAFSLDKPFIGVNHLYAHIFAPFLNKQYPLKFPFLGVVISGGHTEFYKVNDFTDIELISYTIDDACGEVYDKLARVLELGYPGGPVIDKLFNYNYRNAFPFKCGRVGLSLSFSGIKTAVLYKAIKIKEESKLTLDKKIRLVSSFQEAVVSTIVKTIEEALNKYKLDKVVCGGGVVANSYLRKRLLELEKKNFKLLISPKEYAGDNGAIISGLGYYLYHHKHQTSQLTLEAKAN